MNDLYGHSQYVIAVAFSLILYAVLGLCILQISIGRKIEEKLDYLLLSPAIGVASLSISSSVMGKWGIPVSSRNLFFLYFFLIVTAVITSWRNKRNVIANWVTTSHLRRAGPLLVVAVLVGLSPYYALMLHHDFLPGFGTSATWRNNDLGSYLQMASNVVHSGFNNAGYIDGWNAGAQASFDHPAAQSFFAASSQLLFRKPFQMGIVVVSTLLASLFMAGVVVVRRISHRIPPFWAVITSAAIVINPAIFGMVANFFFAQLLAICLTMCAFALGVLSLQKVWSWQSMFLMSVVSFAIFLASPEIAVILLPLILLASALHLPREVWLKTSLKLLCSYSLFGVLLRILSGSLLLDQLDVLHRNTGAGVAGWEANLLSPAALLGFAPTQFYGPYSSGTRILDVLVILFTVVVIFTMTMKKRINSKACSFLCIFLVPVILAVLKWGSTGYQTWKLITTVVPFVGVTLWTLGKSEDTVTNARIRPYISVLVIGATVGWSGYLWRDTTSSSFINSDAAGVSLSVQMKKQSGVNIFVAPYFETMALSVISERPTQMMPPTYQFPNGQSLKYGCTLTTKERVKDLPNAGKIIYQQGDYVLVGTPKCD